MKVPFSIDAPRNGDARAASRTATLYVAIAGLALVAALASYFANGYQQYVIATVAITAIVGVGLNVLLGLAGQLSLGHVGFYAIGAYACAILTTRYGWSFWAVLPLAGVAAAIAGALLAVPALRVRGPYLAMVTIAFGFVIEQSAAEMKGLTGGWNGIMNIPRPTFFGVPMDEFGIGVFALALLAVLLVLFDRLRDSTWGLAMRATRRPRARRSGSTSSRSAPSRSSSRRSSRESPARSSPSSRIS